MMMQIPNSAAFVVDYSAPYAIGLIGLDELIATDEAGYLDIALRLVNDREEFLAVGSVVERVGHRGVGVVHPGLRSVNARGSINSLPSTMSAGLRISTLRVKAWKPACPGSRQVPGCYLPRPTMLY